LTYLLKEISIMMSQKTVETTQAQSRFNRFRFRDVERTTRIVFLPQAPGPVQADDPLNASQLEYEGPEGKFTFRGNEIRKDASPLGRLVSVTLQSNAADAGLITLTLILPPLKIGDEEQLRFETIAIKSFGFGLVPADQGGAQLSYEVLTLRGVADSIVIAF
jgi:hypothetical protein